MLAIMLFGKRRIDMLNFFAASLKSFLAAFIRFLVVSSGECRSRHSSFAVGCV